MKPEDIVKKLIMEQQVQYQGQQQLMVDDYDKTEEDDTDNIDQEEEEEEDEDEDEELEEDRKMGYKMEFQRQNAGPPNGGNGAPSFLAAVR